jgi:hypothetical protein
LGGGQISRDLVTIKELLRDDERLSLRGSSRGESGVNSADNISDAVGDGGGGVPEGGALALVAHDLEEALVVLAAEGAEARSIVAAG